MISDTDGFSWVDPLGDNSGAKVALYVKSVLLLLQFSCCGKCHIPKESEFSGKALSWSEIHSSRHSKLLQTVETR